jgi:hypothetical protein
VGLLDWFWRRGGAAPGDVGAAEPSLGPHEGHGGGVPAGAGSEGPPVGVSDPGSLLGGDDVVAADEGDELRPQ